jgi:hypothetical protein
LGEAGIVAVGIAGGMVGGGGGGGGIRRWGNVRRRSRRGGDRILKRRVVPRWFLAFVERGGGSVFFFSFLFLFLFFVWVGGFNKVFFLSYLLLLSKSLGERDHTELCYDRLTLTAGLTYYSLRPKKS